MQVKLKKWYFYQMLYVDVAAVKMQCWVGPLHLPPWRLHFPLSTPSQWLSKTVELRYVPVRQGTPLKENSGSRTPHWPGWIFLQLDCSPKLFQPNDFSFPLSLHRLWTVFYDLKAALPIFVAPFSNKYLTHDSDFFSEDLIQ